jgi:L,D-transpeptidase-like protein/SH3 domain-containing protein
MPLVVAASLALTVWSIPVHANRFGPPWMARVTTDQTTLYSAPDASSPPVGPLSKGAIVVVVGENSNFTQTPDGWLASSDVAEATQPWTAEVTDPSVAIYAKPQGNGDIRRTAHQGDLVRVTGVSPGVEGDSGLWWATTEGYVGLHTISSTSNPFASQWSLPKADEALKGWWGQVKAANVRAAPQTDAPIVGEFAGGEHVKVLAEQDGADVDGNSKWYRIDGGRFAGAYVHSSLIERTAEPQPTIAPPDRTVGEDPWIVVDRGAETLTLLKSGQPQFVTYVSLGKAGVETDDGNYATFIKFLADRMSSTTVPNADHAYDLPNVPFTEYFKGDGSAIHGTYWHDAFGTQQSQGCINVTWTDGAYLFGQTKPQVPGDQIGLTVNPEQATPVVVVN